MVRATKQPVVLALNLAVRISEGSTERVSLRLSCL